MPASQNYNTKIIGWSAMGRFDVRAGVLFVEILRARLAGVREFAEVSVCVSSAAPITGANPDEKTHLRHRWLTDSGVPPRMKNP
jgi:hypothetical protein